MLSTTDETNKQQQKKKQREEKIVVKIQHIWISRVKKRNEEKWLQNSEFE